jgi:uncharacterized protein (DUF433 family)
MSASYVEEREGNLYIGKSRVTLETIILKWRAGDRPEQLHEGFPSVPLAAIYGAIAYYLEHQQELDRLFNENEKQYQADRAAAEAANPELYASMRERHTFHSEEEFMRGLGMDEEDIAWVEAQPIEADPPEYADLTERGYDVSAVRK